MTYLELEQAILELDSFPLSENAQRLVNYLRANVDDIFEVLAD